MYESHKEERPRLRKQCDACDKTEYGCYGEDCYSNYFGGRVWSKEEFGTVALPHQCNEWEIGDAKAVRLLIRDLQALLDEMEA